MDKMRFPRLEQYRAGGSGGQPEFAIPLPRTPSGKTTLLCPDQGCTPRRFQLGEAPDHQGIPKAHLPLVRREPRTPGITCPYCGTDAEDHKFRDPADVGAVERFALDAMREGVDKYLSDWTRQLNRDLRRQRGFITTRAEYRPGSRRTARLPWREDLLRSLVCPICDRGYGVYAIALFCPDCGSRNVGTHFRREVELILAQLDIAETIGAERSSELAYRLTGNAHEDVVTAFETYLKSLHRFVMIRRLRGEERTSALRELRGNHFQNLDRAAATYREIGVELLKDFTEAEVKALRRNLQKRHLVGHNLGLIDARYAELAGDARLGETVRLVGDETTRFAHACARIITHVEGNLPELLP